MKHSSGLSGALFVLPLAFLAVFFFYPLVMVIGKSFAPEGRLDLTPLLAIWGEPYFRRALWFTTWQATASTALTLLLGLPAAFVFARYRFPGKRLLQALTTIPFVLPAMVVSAAFMALLGPRGWLNELLMDAFGLARPPIRLQQTIWLILIAHAFYNTSVVIRLVGSFWGHLDRKLMDAARLLGARRLRVFWEITLPLLLPAIIAAGLLVFLFCYTSFGIILILGGPSFATLEVEIYRQSVTLFRLSDAAALSLVQMGLTFIIMAVYSRAQARTAVPLNLRPTEEVALPPVSRRQQLLVGATVAGLLIFLVLPLVSLAIKSLAPADPLRFYRELFVNRASSIFYVPPGTAIRNSLLFAGLTTALALFLGTLTATALARSRGALGRLLDPIVLLPLGASAVTLGFGYILAFGRPPLDLRASPVLVPFAHTLVAFPFVVRTLLPVLRGMNPAWRASAAVLGASPWRAWREVELPIIGRALLVAAVFAFTVSMGEFGAPLLIARPEFPTMPVAIFRLLGQPGALNYGQALAMSTLLMLVCAAGFLLIERFRAGAVGEF
ncbi:MAG: iron ABC transporter permease [Anaerolineae bacterium]|nr:iron ABC transporter permease [Anaerolineae bacterium]